jgi:TolB-like protein
VKLQLPSATLLLLGASLLIGSTAHAATATTATTATTVEGPVAVMPFKNLNGDANLDWLKIGMAETMISDLHKGAGLQVVERDQLDRALAELALQGAKGTEESTAAKVGKITGAKTVVLGSFQSAGKQLRIAARFVTVETGVVQDAAKVTGPLDDIFELQDQIVDKLVGSSPVTSSSSPSSPTSPTGATGSTGNVSNPAKPGDVQVQNGPVTHAEGDTSVNRATVSSSSPTRARKPRKKGPKEVKAYQYYAKSLSTSSDAEKVSYLKESLSEDPELSYAVDDLAALETRMLGYDKAHQAATRATEADERHDLELRDGTPQERAKHALQLINNEMQSFRYHALVHDCAAIYEMDLPTVDGINVRAYALHYMFLGHFLLKQTDLALQMGERFMKNYPDSPMYNSVELRMNQIISEKREREEGASKAEAELAKIEQERQGVLAHPPPEKVLPQRMLSLDLRKCTTLQQHHQSARAWTACKEFIENHQAESKPDDEHDLVGLARYYEVLAAMDLGRFADARSAANEMLNSSPAVAKSVGLKMQMTMWPQD